MNKTITIRRRWLNGAMASFLVMSSISTVMPTPVALAQVQANAEIGVIIDGKSLEMSQKPQIIEGRTLVPIRMLMEEMGAEVIWDETNRTVLVSKGDSKSILLRVDNRLVCYEDGGQKTYDVCDVAPQIIKDRTYVPLRLVGNALGITVNWNDGERNVYVDTTIPVEKSKFYNLSLSNLVTDQTIYDQITLKLNYQGEIPTGATQIRYILLDPNTATGKVIAQSNLEDNTQWLPDPSLQGKRVLAASICDAKGNFLAGTAIPINIAVVPQVSLQGINSQANITQAVELKSLVNFAAESIIYEFKSLVTGASTQSQAVDPVRAYSFNPTANYNGAMEIRAIAVDKAGKQYFSNPVAVNVTVPVAAESFIFNKFSTDNLGKIPVKLSVSRNFDVSLTQYWARNTITQQEVLLNEKPYGDFSWLPGPDMAGTWEVYAKVKNPAGKVFTSNSFVVTVPNTAAIILNGIGPNEVISAEVKLKAISNVDLQQVSFIISNPNNGTQKTIGTLNDKAQSITWTPETINEGVRQIRAVAVTNNGQTIESESVSVRIFLGNTYSAKPIVDKAQFINYITPMALATQKETGMSAALQIAQAILETGWGQSVPVDKYTGLFSNNLFGIKGSASAGSVISNTWEEYFGTKYRIDANFRAYHNIQESWDDHNALLLTRERYIPYKEVMYNSTWGAYALQRCGYATDSQYPAKLIKIIKDNNLERFDVQKL